MKLIAYHTQNSLTEMVKLCSKLMKNGKTITIRVGGSEDAKNLSESIWKLQMFLPHGLLREDFDKIQPIIISDEDTERDVFINFEHLYTAHDSLGFSPEIFILWNCHEYNKSFTVYTQDLSGGWRQLGDM